MKSLLALLNSPSGVNPIKKDQASYISGRIPWLLERFQQKVWEVASHESPQEATSVNWDLFFDPETELSWKTFTLQAIPFMMEFLERRLSITWNCWLNDPYNLEHLGQHQSLYDFINTISEAQFTLASVSTQMINEGKNKKSTFTLQDSGWVEYEFPTSYYEEMQKAPLERELKKIELSFWPITLTNNTSNLELGDTFTLQQFPKLINFLHNCLEIKKEEFLQNPLSKKNVNEYQEIFTLLFSKSPIPFKLIRLSEILIAEKKQKIYTLKFVNSEQDVIPKNLEAFFNKELELPAWEFK